MKPLPAALIFESVMLRDPLLVTVSVSVLLAPNCTVPKLSEDGFANRLLRPCVLWAEMGIVKQHDTRNSRAGGAWGTLIAESVSLFNTQTLRSE